MKTTRRWSVVALVAIAAIIASLFGATGAGAYGGKPAKITLSRNVVPQGGSLTVFGTNFTPNAAVTLDLHSAAVLIGSATTDGKGSFSQEVTIPSDTVPGAHSISGTDAAGKHASADLTVTSSNTGPVSASAAPSSTSGGLAGTGVAVVGIGALGIVLLVGGGLMLLAGRRRKNSTHAI